MTIDRNSPLPLYYQLKQLLVEQIANGEWTPGDILPTELSLQKEHDLSRTTVRQAIREMELEGMVTRFRGRGTFVAEPKVVHSPESQNSLTNFLISHGKNPGWKLISAGMCIPPEAIAENLKIEFKKEVFCLRRLRLSDEEPIGYLVSYVPSKYIDAVDESAFTEGGSLNYLRDMGHLEHSRAVRLLEAVPAQEEEAALLGVDIGAPLLQVNRTVFIDDDRPIEDFQAAYRGDRFQYQISSPTSEITQLESDG